MRPKPETQRNIDMEFTEEPLEAKKFGIKWIKYRIVKYPQVFIVVSWIPFVTYGYFKLHSKIYRETNSGEYVPNVMRNRYLVVRPDSWLLDTTPVRYRS